MPEESGVAGSGLKLGSETISRGILQNFLGKAAFRPSVNL
jgi:hypothetical protein